MSQSAISFCYILHFQPLLDLFHVCELSFALQHFHFFLLQHFYLEEVKKNFLISLILVLRAFVISFVAATLLMSKLIFVGLCRGTALVLTIKTNKSLSNFSPVLLFSAFSIFYFIFNTTFDMSCIAPSSQSISSVSSENVFSNYSINF